MTLESKKEKLMVKRSLLCALEGLLLLVLFLLPASQVFAAPSHENKPLSGFQETCYDLHLASVSGSELEGTCRKNDGTYNSSSLDLNLYIGNINGIFTPNSSNFLVTCPSTNSTGNFTLVSLCNSENHSLIQSSLNLDPYISNLNGNLVWQG